MKDEFYGDRVGAVKDTDGNQYWISTHVKDMSNDELQTQNLDREAKKAKTTENWTKSASVSEYLYLKLNESHFVEINIAQLEKKYERMMNIFLIVFIFVVQFQEVLAVTCAAQHVGRECYCVVKGSACTGPNAIAYLQQQTV